MGTWQRSSVTRGAGVLAVTILLSGAAVAAGSLASAATFDVTNTNDSGVGSLRQAVLDAEDALGDDTINIQVGLGTIVSSSSLAWDGGDALTIEGNGVTVDFDGAPSGFVDIAGDGIDIESMTITGVTGSGSDDQAPIVSEGGNVTAGKCTITGNDVTTDEGDVAGGILAEGGNVVVNACTITGNAAHGSADGAGGVLAEGGNVTISNSTISGNTVVAGGDVGGGLDSEGGDVIITGSTINCNSATSDGGDAGGGILNEGGSLTIRTSSIIGNSATTTDGLASNSIESPTTEPTINDSTVSDDTAVCAVPPPTSAPPTTAPPAGTQAVAATPAFTG